MTPCFCRRRVVHRSAIDDTYRIRTHSKTMVRHAHLNRVAQFLLWHYCIGNVIHIHYSLTGTGSTDTSLTPTIAAVFGPDFGLNLKRNIFFSFFLIDPQYALKSLLHSSLHAPCRQIYHSRCFPRDFLSSLLLQRPPL